MSSDHAIKILHVLDGFRLSYHYSLVDIYTPQDIDVDFSNLKYGLQSSLVPEPENHYDQKAIAVYVSDIKVGYLYRNRLQSMAHDYISASLPIYSYIDSIDTEARKITIFLAFYGTTFAPNKIYKLSGSRSKAAQEAIEIASEGETTTVTYDYDKQRYNVFVMDDLIGYLPQPAENYARDYNCIIHAIETDDSDKYVVYVRFERPSSKKASTPPPPDPIPVSAPPPEPKPAQALKPDPVLERAERALSSATASSTDQPKCPVSPDAQRTKELFLVLYPNSKITLCQQLSGGGSYFSIHAVLDGKENRYIVQYDAQANAIDCYDSRMNPLSTTRKKAAEGKRRHPVLWLLFVAAIVLAVVYVLR